MFLNRLLMVFAVAMAVGLVGLAGAGANMAMQARAEPTAVGVVNLGRVFDELKQSTAVNAELQQRREQLEAEEADRRRALQQLQEDLNSLPAGTPHYAQKQEELAKKAIELRVWAEYQTQMLQREHGLQIEQMYRQTLAGISRVAQDSGYDLVMFKPGALQIANATAQQVSEEIRSRPVLYARDAVDITEQVIQRMNNEYEAGL